MNSYSFRGEKVMKKNKFNKNKIVLVILFILVLGLTGCNSTSPTKVAKGQATAIIEYVITKDNEGLKSLFTPESSLSSTLEQEIEDFLNFIDGNIISYDKIYGGRDNAKLRYGKAVYEKLYGKVSNIKTDTGKNYEIRHYAISVDEEKTDEIGVYCIIIVDLDTYDSDIGYPDYGKRIIGQFRKSE